MCITFFKLHSTQKSLNLMLSFNRDEDSSRPTQKLDFFAQDKNIIAGRDCISKGTCLGINIKTGLVVVLTNIDVVDAPRHKKSRGKLVYSFLESGFGQGSHKEGGVLNKEELETKIMMSLTHILQNRQQYYAFNLSIISLSLQKIFYINSTDEKMISPQLLSTNKLHALCNNQYSKFKKYMWPKTQYGYQMCQKILTKIQSQKFGFKEVVELMQPLMEDTTAFSQDPDEQSSIFVPRFYSKTLERDRQTKTSTYIVATKSKESQNTDILLVENTFGATNKLKQTTTVQLKNISFK